METINIYNNLHLLYLVVDEIHTKLKITLINILTEMCVVLESYRILACPNDQDFLTLSPG